MTWRKTWFSYVLWVCCAVPAFMFTGIAAGFTGRDLGITETAALIGVLCVPFAMGAVLFAVGRVCVKKIHKSIPTGALAAAEGLMFVGLIAAGVLLRMAAFPPEETNIYYEMAQVEQGKQVMPIAHGALYYYILLLHGLFTFIGNKWMAGVVLQVVLQLIAAVLLYIAVRKIGGAFVAVWTFGFIMLAPDSVRISLTYGPEMFYLVLYALGLLFLSVYLKMIKTGRWKKWYQSVGLALLGGYISFLMYLDVIGISLAALGMAAIWLKPEDEDSDQKQKDGVIAFLVMLAGVIAGILTIFLLDALQSGSDILSVMSVWEWLFTPMGFDWRRLCIRPMTMEDQIAGGVLVTGLVTAVISFFVHKKQERQSAWMLLAVVSLCLSFLCRADENMNRMFPWFLALVVIAGVGIRTAFEKFEKAVSVEVIESEGQEMPQMTEVIAETTETTDITEVTEVTETEHVEEVAETEEKPKIQFIENPLPLPKKHVKKTMGYKFDPAEEQMEFDIEIEDGDDFDL